MALTARPPSAHDTHLNEPIVRYVHTPTCAGYCCKQCLIERFIARNPNSNISVDIICPGCNTPVPPLVLNDAIGHFGICDIILNWHQRVSDIVEESDDMAVATEFLQEDSFPIPLQLMEYYGDLDRFVVEIRVATYIATEIASMNTRSPSMRRIKQRLNNYTVALVRISNELNLSIDYDVY